MELPRRLIELFEKAEGRRPRILVVQWGPAGQDRDPKVIAGAFAAWGFDVDIGPPAGTLAEIARQAVENDVHIIGVNLPVVDHESLVPQLMGELKKMEREDLMIVDGKAALSQNCEPLLLELATRLKLKLSDPG